MFTGNYERNLDEKCRLIIPASYRKYLEVKFYLTPGLDKECLFIYPLSEWEELVKKLKTLPKSDEDAQDYIRRFFSSSTECLMDRQGRIAIPNNLMRYAGLSENVVVAGVLDRVEIWSAEKWAELQEGEEFRKLSKKVLSQYLI
ncbi:MAG: division/cell wall cluster transcriptional repressor MraZ [Candidatus Eremiobacterota bacterium]